MGRGNGRRLVALLGFALLSSIATAASQRTFVSPTGSDTNPCSLAQPCRTFGAAITQTASGGEVIVLDSAGYGSVTIAQSVSIIAPPGIYAGISLTQPSANGVAINGSNIDVVLRGLTIIALGGANGTIGVNVMSARSVTVDRCTISGVNGDGIYSQASTQLTISNSELRGNSTGIASNGGTIDVENSRILDSNQTGINSSSGVALHVDRSEIAGSGNSGIQAVSSVAGVLSKTTISQARLAKNGSQGLAVSSLAGGLSEVAISDSVIADNGNQGLNFYADAGSTTRVAGSRLTINGNVSTGVLAASGGASSLMVLALSDSTVSGNGGDGVNSYAVDPAAVTSVTLAANRISGNVGSGVTSQFPGATIAAHNNTISRNNIFGLWIVGGAINSDGSNVVNENKSGDLFGGVLGPLPKY